MGRAAFASTGQISLMGQAATTVVVITKLAIRGAKNDFMMLVGVMVEMRV
jgi:hypothetical protein